MKTGERWRERERGGKRETDQREEEDQNVKPLGLGRKCNGRVRGDGKGRLQWQRAGSSPHGLLGRHGNGRMTGRRRDGTDGGRGACKKEV